MISFREAKKNRKLTLKGCCQVTDCSLCADREICFEFNKFEWDRTKKENEL